VLWMCECIRLALLPLPRQDDVISFLTQAALLGWRILLLRQRFAPCGRADSKFQQGLGFGCRRAIASSVAMS